MRRRVRSEPQLDDGDDLGTDEQGGRQFISALARGLDVLRCFRRGEPPLTNQEIARRTGLPRPTISRIIYTLRDMGYLRYYPKNRVYALGGAAYSLGLIADQNFDPIGAIRPILQRYAMATGTNIGLSTRERTHMVYVEGYEGASLVGLQMRVGDNISLTESAIGLAYLAGTAEGERNAILRQLKREGLADIDAVSRQVAIAQEELARYGFCLSLGKMRSEIHGVTIPIAVSKLDGLYVLSSGGPAYLLPTRKLLEEIGPMLLRAARELQEVVGLRPFVPRSHAY